MKPEAPIGVAIVGATATGKSELAIRVARRLDGEIIGVDSRQAYRGMAVGTAVPEAAQLEAVRHHGIAFLDPTEEYGAGRFARLARGWIREIRARERVPVLSGGTGFFLGALVRPVFEEPAMDPERRRALRGWLETLPLEELRRWAACLDPEWSGDHEVVDRQRASRALELALLSGNKLSWWQGRSGPEAEPVSLLLFGLELPPEIHRERIRRRIESQLAGGWMEEVKALRAAALPESAPALNAVGYREVGALIDGDLERDRAVEQIARHTWQYARRQRTWFRHQLSGLRWLDGTEPIDHLADLVEREWRRS